MGPTRRTALGTIAGGAGLMKAAAPAIPRVACVMNTWYPNSHADVFMQRLLDGYRLNGAWHPPRVKAVKFYVDQFPFNDMAREQAAEYGIQICSTVAEAGRDVDGIAVLGEHGDYPRTPLGNFAYPRKRYFDQLGASTVPRFNDKYLAYAWADAKAMYDHVRAAKIPFLCGSTVPLSWQRPPLKFSHADELLAISYSDLEEHAYHAIEMMQSVAERSRQGVAQVRYVEGDEVWRISPKLREAALSRRVNPAPEDKGQKPEAFLIRYEGGLQASVLNLNSKTRDYLLAVRNGGDIEASCFYIGLYTHSHWGFLVRAFEDLVLTKRNPTPIERTLMANGIMLAGLESRKEGGAWVDTPHLSFSY